MARRKKSASPIAQLLTLAVVVAVVVIGSTAFWNMVEENIPDPLPTDPTDVVQAGPGETTPEETTRPELVIAEDATGMEAIAAFAQYHGIDIAEYGDEAYLAKLAEGYDKSPEARDFVLAYAQQKNVEHTVDMSEFENVEGVPLFIQWDDRWGYTPYGLTVGGLTGCGPTCLSMVAWYYTQNDDFTPDKIMAFSTEKGYVTGGNTAWTLFSQGAKELGFEVRELPLVKKRVTDCLEQGIPVVISVGPGLFTSTGHFVVLTGYEDGRLLVNDPNSERLSKRGCTWEEIEEQIKNLWAITYPGEQEATEPGA